MNKGANCINKKNLPSALYWIIAVLVFVILYIIFTKLGGILFIIIFAVFLAYLADSIVNFLCRFKIKRNLSVFLSFVFIVSIIALILIIFIPAIIENAADFVSALPGIIKKYQDMINDFVTGFLPDGFKFESSLEPIITEGFKNMVNVVYSTGKVFFDLLASLVIAYYLVLDKKTIKKGLLTLVPRKYRDDFIDTLREIGKVINGFIKGHLLVSLMIGMVETIGLIILGVEYPLVLGIIGGVTNIIPYFGPIIGVIPALLVAFLSSPAKVVWTLVLFMGVQQIENNFISPKIMEVHIGLHPVTTIIAVLVGGVLFGIAGMIFSLPVTAILKILLMKTLNAISSRYS